MFVEETKKVLKNTKNMTPNSSSVRPEKFHPYANQLMVWWTNTGTKISLYEHHDESQVDLASPSLPCSVTI